MTAKITQPWLPRIEVLLHPRPDGQYRLEIVKGGGGMTFDEELDQLTADVNEQLDTLGALAKRIRETRSHGYNREHRALGERLDVFMDALLEDLAAGLRRLITTCQ